MTQNSLSNFESYIEFLNDEFGGDKRFSFLISPVYDWGGQRIQSLKGELVDNLSDFYKILLPVSFYSR